MYSLQVNEDFLTVEDIRARAAALRMEREASGQILSLDDRLALRQEAVDLLIECVLLVQEARRLNLTPPDSEVDAVAGCRPGENTAESREDLRRRMMIDLLVQRWRSAVLAPGPQEVRAYYQKNKDQFHSPEIVHASHIVRHFEAGCESQIILDEVEHLRARVLAGESFARIAADHSDCPENQGDLGWFARGLMVDEFDAVVFSTPASQLTPVFRTVFGYHFASIHNRRAAGIRPFDEVRPELQQSLWLAKQDREVGKQLAALRQRATIRSIA